MVVFWRQHRVIVMSYIDDFVVLGWSKEQVLWLQDQFIALLLLWLGWVCEPTKGVWELTQVAEVLGLTVNLRDGVFSVLSDKVLELVCLCAANCQLQQSWCQLVQLMGMVVVVSCVALLL
jgi:hypothetical protein